MDFDIIKVWIVNLLSVLLVIMESTQPYIEFLGVVAATIYTFYKILIMYKNEKAKSKAK